MSLFDCLSEWGESAEEIAAYENHPDTSLIDELWRRIELMSKLETGDTNDRE